MLIDKEGYCTVHQCTDVAAEVQSLTRCIMLQFRFNVRDVEMGTRRPLIVQMVR